MRAGMNHRRLLNNSVATKWTYYGTCPVFD